MLKQGRIIMSERLVKSLSMRAKELGFELTEININSVS
jgi:hypothetical protein